MGGTDLCGASPAPCSYLGVCPLSNDARTILVELYNATNGANWLNTWPVDDASSDPCSWSGVACGSSDGYSQSVTCVLQPSLDLLALPLPLLFHGLSDNTD